MSARRSAAALVALALACGGSPSQAPESTAAAGSKRDFDRSIAEYHRGVSELEKGSAEAAERIFREAARLDDRNHAAWFQIGVQHERRGQWQQAAGILTRAARLVPKDAVYAHHLGRSLLESGKPKLGREHLQRSVTAEAGQYRTHYFLGVANQRLGEPGKAASAWTEAARLEPCFMPSFERLAELYEAWGFDQRALAVAARGMECAKPSRSPWRLYAVCARVNDKLQQRDSALSCFASALALSRVADLLLRRGMLYYRLGYHDEARRDLREYLASPERSSWNEAFARSVLGKLR